MIMRVSVLPFYLALLCSVAIGTSAEAQEGSARGFRVETEGLILEWRERPDSTEVEAVTAEVSEVYDRVAELLDVRPEGKVTIVLGGAAERPGENREYPRVDSMGRVLLFKFIPDFHNYFTALAHEMVHRFRFHRRGAADWFFEEGFAEFVALRVDPSLAGFPWFDFPVAIVAGQWVAEGTDIRLTLLRGRHRELNLKCGAQSYALRAAFFDWLGINFSDERVLQAASKENAGAVEDYESFFGKPFEQLTVDWREALLAEYRERSDADALAKAYREESPIKYQRVCAEGEDF
jgi:hypothetical protein